MRVGDLPRLPGGTLPHIPARDAARCGRPGPGVALACSNGNPVLRARHCFPRHFVNKLFNRYGNATLSSQAIFRVAEVYLKPAEANARLGNRPVVRDYPGAQLSPGNLGMDMQAGTQTIPADPARMVFFIPRTKSG